MEDTHSRERKLAYKYYKQYKNYKRKYHKLKQLYGGTITTAESSLIDRGDNTYSLAAVEILNSRPKSKKIMREVLNYIKVADHDIIKQRITASVVLYILFKRQFNMAKEVTPGEVTQGGGGIFDILEEELSTDEGSNMIQNVLTALMVGCLVVGYGPEAILAL